MLLLIKRPLAVIGLLLGSAAVQADALQPTVNVTAHRVATDIDASLSTVSVIDRQAIELGGSIDLVDLLRRQAGVDIVRTGGVGGQTSLFLRGAKSNQVLVLIDGVRASSVTAGLFAFESLALEQIERIEVVRGPRAALYGSDAIGGVIQIFTRRSSGASGSLGVGSYGAASADLGYTHAFERGRIGLRLGYLDIDGFSSQNEDGFSFDPDDDGQVQRSISSFFDYDFTALALEGVANRSHSLVEFDRGRSDIVNSNASVSLRGGEQQSWLLRASSARDKLETADFFSRFETRREALDWQHSLNLADGGLLWGLSALSEEGVSIDTFSGSENYGDEREQLAGFASWRADIGPLNYELSGRHDDYDQYGGSSTAQVALGWTLDEDVRLLANWGQGFRAPTLNELLSPGFGGLFAGNPELDPERSRSTELGVDVALSAQAALRLRLYRSELTDLIDFSGGDTFQAINVARARLQGAELEGAWHWGAWQFDGNLGWQQAIDRDSEADLLRRAPRKVNVSAQRSFARGLVGLDLHAVAARPEFGGELPGYVLFGAFARWQVSAPLAVDLRLENLGDVDYELARGYNAPGLTAMLNLRWDSAAR
ncbi:TonB-dependent receptor domain-containing protein [Pseudomarimonas arenosa]|uniref:TonB-dependent receptor n=1 Tax=Pseudomarimonas arenosa TaxID=2774145 RepID=A0AAW3ZUX4_9GAMM|nr:TonB-dependent receptor [Pseudomarimonas arenosa]MBD8527886.1 TonB-dependent receptor [Pseudomarimonas arenosa]